MRTAEKIFQEDFGHYASYQDIDKEDVIKVINEARKEVIEECAKRAKSEWIRYGSRMGHAVDRQSILSLINELK